MQVNHTTDNVTHAIVGGAAQINMGISDSAEFFQILSSTLYSDQMLAVVRETTCNAWDAHVDAGCTDVPIKITVDDDKIVIQDFGLGIHRDMMGPIYGIYGASTKKNDGKQTGGFGLGCKAPFAYTDHFQVTSCHDGIKTIYSMSKSSAQVGGKPAIIPIASFPTEETGLEVSINIKRSDRLRFRMLFQQIIRNGEMNAELNGEIAEVTPYSEAKHGFMIMYNNPMSAEVKTERSINVRYGNVIYPLKNHNEIKNFDNVINMLNKLPGGSYYYGSSGTCSLVLLAPPHSISVTPSRESLSMQEHTINTVNKLLADFLAYMATKSPDLDNKLLVERMAKADTLDLLNHDRKLTNHTFNLDAWRDNKLMISDHKMYRRGFLASNHAPEMHKKDVMLRISKAEEQKLFVRGKAYSLLRAVQRTPLVKLNGDTDWVGKHIVNPVVRKMRLNDELNVTRLFFVRNDTCTPVKSLAAPVFMTSWAMAARYARPYVVIHYVRKEVSVRINKEGTLKGANVNEVLFYHAPRVLAKVEAAIKFFTDMGYQVIDLTKPLAGEAPEAVEPVGKVKSLEPRKIGLIALSAAASVSGTFRGDNLYDTDAERVMEPECLFLCTDTDGQRGANHLQSFGGVSTTVMELYGDVAGVAKTCDQYQRYNSKGIAAGLDYVMQDVIDYVTSSDVLLRHMVAIRTMKANSYDREIYNLLFKSEACCKAFGLPFISDKKDKDYLTLWNYLLFNAPHHNMSLMRVTERDIATLPEDQATLDICEKIAVSKYFQIIQPCYYSSRSNDGQLYADFINLIIQ